MRPLVEITGMTEDQWWAKTWQERVAWVVKHGPVHISRPEDFESRVRVRTKNSKQGKWLIVTQAEVDLFRFVFEKTTREKSDCFDVLGPK